MNDTTIHLISGEEFDYLEPEAAHVELYDVAWALARISRYNGHVEVPWTVGQHVLLVTAIVCNIYAKPQLGLGALHHDDCEFVTMDWPTPLKEALRIKCGVDYAREFERPIEHALAPKLGIVIDELHAGAVKDADALAYEAEVRVLKPNGYSSRQEIDEGILIDTMQQLGTIGTLTPSEITKSYMICHHQLMERR